MPRIEWIFVHHTAVSYDKNPDQFAATNEYHRKKWGRKSKLGYYGGYTYEIAKDGTTRQFRQIGEQTIAVYGHNHNSVSIALDGDFDGELPTEAQHDALRSLLARLVAEYDVDLTKIVPHRAKATKTCYGRRLPDDWARNLLTPNPMRYVIDENRDQWLIAERPVKLAISIADEKVLQELQQRGLVGAPEAISGLDGYLTYRGASEDAWKAFLNL